MTISIANVLAVSPSGARHSDDLRLEEIARYLADNCNRDADVQREQRYALRDRLYWDGGVEEMKAFIQKVFSHSTLRTKREAWVEFARFNNALKRVVNELSTVYAEPAKRTVDGDTNNANYQAVQRACRQDEQMQLFGRMFNLHPAVAMGFRVRELEDGRREPVIDLATPASFRPVLHPVDRTRLIGILVKSGAVHARAIDARNAPAWTLWTDHERISLNDNFMALDKTHVEHELGVCPWTIATRWPSVPNFWPGDDGESLTSAQFAIWFANISMLKEAKDGTRLTVTHGDMTTAARNQAMDTGEVVSLPEGSTINNIDTMMDLGAFRETADHILESVANNYGMSGALMRHQGVQSAEARELMRVPLRELRRQQQTPLHLFERQLVKVQAAICSRETADLKFSADGWRIEFADPQTPLTPSEELAMFEKKRAAGLTNTYDFMRSLNPDMSDEQAQESLLRNIDIEVTRNEAMRPLQAIAGGASLSFGDKSASGEVQASDDVDVPPPAIQPDAPSARPGDGVSRDIQREALNGAQVTSMAETVRLAAVGEIPRESAIAIIEIAYQLSNAEAARIVGPVGFRPTIQAPPAATGVSGVADPNGREGAMT